MRSAAAVNAKRVVYVGGLADEVTEDILRSAMVPFGDVIEVHIPIDYVTQQNRGFGFVEFGTAEEASSAIDNMHGSEIFGKTLKVNVARSMFTQPPPEHARRAVWAEDDWLKKYVIEDEAASGDEAVKPPVEKPISVSSNPKTFLEIQIDGRVLGKLIIELRVDLVPKTCDNFRRLCTGDLEAAGAGAAKSNKLSYRNCVFHRIINGFMGQTGDVIKNDGTGGRSVFGEKFDDENFELKHSKAGILSMANSGPNSNNSQFFITFGACDWLDGRHVVFGRVVDGLWILKRIEACGSKAGTPKKNVFISSCGEITDN